MTQTDDTSNLIQIHRSVFDQEDFDKRFGARHVSLSARSRISRYMAKWRLYPERRIKKFFLTLLPCITWISEYNPRTDILADCLSGLTVGVMNIPQGMAYGLLALLPPQYGLYTSFFPPLIYMIFGTSKHVSFGTFAVVSLMVRSVIEKNVPILPPSSGNHVHNFTENPDLQLMPFVHHSFSTTPSNLPAYIPKSGFLNFCASSHSGEDRDLNQRLAVAFSLTFLVGVFQILFGFLQAGFLSVYLSDQLVEGLTTGAAFQVLTSQVAKLFGITGLPSASGIFGLFRYYTCLVANVTKINTVTMSTAFLCIVLLIVSKQWIEPVVKRKYNFPIPIELIVVVFGTLLSYLTNMKRDFGVATVGNIPTGLPYPAVPNFSYIGVLLSDAIAISVVIFSISISMCKLFAKKHDYSINANQEWFAYGVIHLISSFFACHCSGSSLSRSVLQESQGGKSKFADLVACLVILLVLLVLAPLFYSLPECALAAIIIVNLKSMIWQVGKLPTLYRQSQIDFLIWVVTFVAVLTLDISIGLMVGVAFAMMTVVFRTQWPDSICLGRIPETEIYKGVNAYSSAYEMKGVKIYRFDSPLYFANASVFKEQLYNKVTLHPVVRRKSIRLNSIITLAENGTINSNYIEHSDFGARLGRQESLTMNNNQVVNGTIEDADVQAIIIDCSSFPYIDIMGCDVLRQVYEELHEVGVVVLFSCVKIAVRQMFLSCNFYNFVPQRNVFVTVHDAVEALMSEKFRDELAKKPDALANLLNS